MLLLAYITQQYVKYFAVVAKKTIDYVKKNKQIYVFPNQKQLF